MSKSDENISRQDAIDALAKFVPYAICDESTESYTNGLTDAYNLILQLPSADRPTGWIPVSERLPEDDELMLVTFKEPRECCEPIWIGWHEMENVWYIDGEEHSAERGNEVIAWMPLPEPYKGGAEE